MGLGILRRPPASSNTPRWWLGLLCFVVLLSRLPFLHAGYGANFDAWRVARVARDISTTGDYSVSRFPGYPVQEIVCSWVWRGGPVALNGLTALLSVAAVAAFVLIARKLRYPNAFFGGLALAATPIFFISSVCSKDYVWALAFSLASLLAVLHRRPLLAGALLGFGAGCRITTLGMMLPLALILAGEDRERAPLALLKFALTAMLTAILVFSSVWLRYGTGFLTFYTHHLRPGWVTTLRRGTIEVWGVIGLTGLVIAAASLFGRRANAALPNKFVVPAFILAITIYVGTYLRLPDQAGYLLPIVPFGLLLTQHFIRGRVFQVLCMCLFVSPFVDVARTGLKPGPIFADHAERLETMARIRSFLAYSETLPGRNTFVVGAWEPQIAVIAPVSLVARNRYVYLLDGEQLFAALRNSDHVFYLPLMREFNYSVYQLDLARYGALDLRKIFEHQQVAPAPAP